MSEAQERFNEATNDMDRAYWQGAIDGEGAVGYSLGRINERLDILHDLFEYDQEHQPEIYYPKFVDVLCNGWHETSSEMQWHDTSSEMRPAHYVAGYLEGRKAERMNVIRYIYRLGHDQLINCWQFADDLWRNVHESEAMHGDPPQVVLDEVAAYWKKHMEGIN